MNDGVMYICGLSMELENAREMGHIGKCIGCLHTRSWYDNGRVYCKKRDEVVEQQEDCPEWVVDHR